MDHDLTLVSHHLCPYVQRAVISLTEKKVRFRRVDVDLADKPAWFKTLSPLGKTPVLRVGETAIFESSVILEYLEETQPAPLHPANAIKRAEHRSWIAFGSAVLNGIGGLYNAANSDAFAGKAAALEERFSRLEARIASPWFDGETFSLVDAVFGPVFRYFDVFDEIGNFGILTGKPKVAAWRGALATRPSVMTAVDADYNGQLRRFLVARRSYLTELMQSPLAN